MQVDEQFVAVPGGNIFVRSWTSTQTARARTPLILLHDSLGSVDQWREFPAKLAALLNRRVIAYDRLGFGKSSARINRPSIHFVKEEAELYFPAVKSALGIRDFALFGHSVGGGMAIAIAASHSAHCKLVITESAQAFVEERTANGIRAAREFFKQQEPFEKLARWHGHKTRWVLDAWIGVWLSPEFADWSLDPLLPNVVCPVMSIHGDEDEYGSVAFPKFIVERVGGISQLEILEGDGHIPHKDSEALILGLIEQFLVAHLSD